MTPTASTCHYDLDEGICSSTSALLLHNPIAEAWALNYGGVLNERRICMPITTALL